MRRPYIFVAMGRRPHRSYPMGAFWVYSGTIGWRTCSLKLGFLGVVINLGGVLSFTVHVLYRSMKAMAAKKFVLLLMREDQPQEEVQHDGG